MSASLISQIEASLALTKHLNVFIGNISESITDEVLLSLFTVCGGAVKRWRRALDAQGQAKTFGFLELASADGVMRLVRMLDQFPLLGKQVTVGVEMATRHYVEAFWGRVKGVGGAEALTALRRLDDEALVELAEVLRAKHLINSLSRLEALAGRLGDPRGHWDEIMARLDALRREEVLKERISPPSSGVTSPTTAPSGTLKSPKAIIDWNDPAYLKLLRRIEHEVEPAMAARLAQQAKRTVQLAAQWEQEREEIANLLATRWDDRWALLASLRPDQLEPETDTLPRSGVTAPWLAFYADRPRWRDRRDRELAHLLEADRRDREREAEYELLEDEDYRPDPTKPSLFDHATGTRKPLLGADRREQILQLIAQIPVDPAQLYEWQVDWGKLREGRLLNWLRRKIPQQAEELLSLLRNRPHPTSIIEINHENPALLVHLLWRWLVFETEAQAYSLL